MSKLLPLLQTIYNLKNVHRTGINLFAGVDIKDIESSATHCFLVSELSMIFGDMARKAGFICNTEVLLKIALYHEWGEAVLGDYPDKSPSYQSYYEVDIRKINKKAEQKARLAMIQVLDGVLDQEYEKLFSDSDFETERMLFSLADEAALLMEVLELVYKGFKLRWFDYMWANQMDVCRKKTKEFPFLQTLFDEFQEAYENKIKDPNPFLTKKEFQKHTQTQSTKK